MVDKLQDNDHVRLPKQARIQFSSQISMKKRSEDTQTLQCALVVVRLSQKKIRPTADPLPGGAGRPKFNQLEMVTTFT